MPTVYATTALRDAVVALLTADSGFQELGAQLVARKRGQLLSEIAAKVAGIKLAVVVNAAEVVEVNPNTNPPLLKEVRLALTVSETRLNDGREVEEVAEYLVRFLHAKPVPAMGPDVLLFIEERPWVSAEAPGVSMVTVSFRCTGLPAQPAVQAA